MDSNPLPGEEKDPGVDGSAHVGWWSTRVGDVIDWARSHSLSPLPLAGSCCAQLGAAVGPEIDLDEFGGGIVQYAPAHADLLIVSGSVSPARAEVLRRIYAQMATPRWVVAFGNCACAGGAFADYAPQGDLSGTLPVDIFIPGCPPRSEALLDGLAKLRGRVRRSG
ncbi:MAG: NADH-quinone oxidoreductase subunit NuoB [Myxococcota bacterium]|nr:NADH-quinone oxidoreductase subunit NuoB [Myxococcota bacterium]